MAQSGYTPILIYASGTATNVPLAANMTSSASGAELALNYADGKLYYKNSSGVVTLLASATTVTNSFSAGTTGLTPNTATTGAVTLAGTLATTNGGTGLTSFTANGVVYASSTSALATGSALTFNGTTLTVAGFSNTGNEIIGTNSSNTLTVNSTITSNLIFTDNTYDIGASGATRPRSIYLAGNATLGGSGGVTLTTNAAKFQSTYGGVTSTNLFTDSGGGVLSVDGSNTISLRTGGISGTNVAVVSPTGLDVNGALTLEAVALPTAGSARIFCRNTDSTLYLQAKTAGGINLLDGSQNSMALFASTQISFLISNVVKAGISSLGVPFVGSPSNTALAGWSGISAQQYGNSAYVFGDGQFFNWNAGISMNAYRSANSWYNVSGGSLPISKFEMGNGGTGADAGFGWWWGGGSASAGQAANWTKFMTLDTNGTLVLAGTAAASGQTAGLAIGSGFSSITNTGSVVAPTIVTSGSLEFNIDGVSGTQRHGRIAGNGDTSAGAYAGGLTFEYYGFNGSAYQWYTGMSLTSVGNFLLSSSSVNNARVSIGCASGTQSIAFVIGSGVTRASGTQYGYTQYRDSSTETNAVTFVENSGSGNNAASYVVRTNAATGGTGVTNVSGGVALVNGATSWSSYSDLRLKHDVVPVTNAIESILKIDPIFFKWNDRLADQQRSIGVSAQSVEKVFPELIDRSGIYDVEGGAMQVRYTELIPVLLASIQEQQAIIESLKARLDAANL